MRPNFFDTFISSKINNLKLFFEGVGEISDLFWLTIRCSFVGKFYWQRLFEQIYRLGIESISLTVVIGLAMGLVMTLNFGYGLVKFGGTLYVPAVVGLSLAREMAPLFTSLLIAGRVGSGIASEIGSMNVTQQIDAIRALGTSPIRILVVPNFWALVISLPLLSALAFALGILGGLIVSNNEFDIQPSFYLGKVFSAINLSDYLSGLFKSIAFAMIITTVAAYKGLKTKDGTRGVGSSTTWVVVCSSILILISDFVIGKAFLMIWN